MNNELDIRLKLKGESSFFIQMVMAQTNKSFPEIMSDMISIYKQVYINRDQELAWIEGDKVKQKLSTINLWRDKC